MLFRKWIESAGNAIEGIIHAARTQRHLRYHFFAASAVLFAGYVLGLRSTDFLIITLTIIVVIVAEMINTAVECVVDMLSPEYHERARIAKDVAAGAVFIAAFGAAVIGYILLFPHLRQSFEKSLSIARHSKEDVTLISLILVVVAVVVLKAYFGKGHPLRGGMPSGHAAVSFSAWVAVTFITENFKASLLCLALALIVAQSRVSNGAHSYPEVVVGALLGAGMTAMLFLVFH